MRKFYYRSFIFNKLGYTRHSYNDGDGTSPPVVVPPVVVPPGDEDKPTFSQKQLNAILAKEKRQAQDSNKKTVEELEKIKQIAGLSEERVAELTNQITELEKTYMSQQELAKRDSEKQAKEYQARLEKAETTAKTHEQRFTKLLVNHAISAAASANDAWKAEQMLTQLGGLAKVVPVLLDGKETGDYEVKIQFPDKTKEGQFVVLDLTPDATMKRMKELPELYGNLFKSGVQGGVGGNNNGVQGTNSNDLNSVTADPETYRKNRKTLLK